MARREKEPVGIESAMAHVEAAREDHFLQFATQQAAVGRGKGAGIAATFLLLVGDMRTWQAEAGGRCIVSRCCGAVSSLSDSFCIRFSHRMAADFIGTDEEQRGGGGYNKRHHHITAREGLSLIHI